MRILEYVGADQHQAAPAAARRGLMRAWLRSEQETGGTHIDAQFRRLLTAWNRDPDATVETLLALLEALQEVPVLRALPHVEQLAEDPGTFPSARRVTAAAQQCLQVLRAYATEERSRADEELRQRALLRPAEEPPEGEGLLRPSEVSAASDPGVLLRPAGVTRGSGPEEFLRTAEGPGVPCDDKQAQTDLGGH